MAGKQSKVSRGWLFIWFMLTGLIFLLTPHSLTSRLQFTFARIFHWPLSVGRTISLSTRPYPRLTNNHQGYENHISNLDKLLDEAHQKIVQLSGLRQRSVWQNVKFIPADITKNSNGRIIINRGAVDGPVKGCYVLGENSIIGTISELSPYAAEVTLITDPSCKIPVEIAKLKITRLMEGAGDNTAKIPLLPKKYKVRKGDAVYASRKAGFLDAVVIAGRVSNCKRNEQNPHLWDITVKPVCDIERLKNIAVIIVN